MLDSSFLFVLFDNFRLLRFFMGLYFFRRRSRSLLSADLANLGVRVEGDDPGLTASGLKLSAFFMGVVDRAGMFSISLDVNVNIIFVGLH
jgi:hypothetical protein